MTTEIPNDTILRLNAERVIPIERYEEDGHFDRFGYLCCLAEDEGADLAAVIALADLLGPEEDFDGLVGAIEDAAEIFGVASSTFTGEAGA